jgi:hypothetical protein
MKKSLLGSWAVFILLCASFFLILLKVGEMDKSDFDRRLDEIVAPYRFSLLGWEAETFWQRLQLRFEQQKELPEEQEIALVKKYFSSDSKTQEDGLGDRVERIVGRQVREALKEEGIGERILFPPPVFKLGFSPSVLIVSFREKIEIKRSIYLLPRLTQSEKEKIEAEVDKLGVSSLVEETGGVAVTLPVLISRREPLQRIFSVVIHEWVHQYLFFRPLGFRYLLYLWGWAKDHEIAVINETVADIVGEEIGNKIYYKYYAEQKNEAVRIEREGEQGNKEKKKFSFSQEMREIRLQVDQLLAEGKIEKAENYMRKKRDELEKQGYYIRKLNQAYFAFHGTYADAPASVDPIGQKLKQLRKKSSSLKDFLRRVQRVSSVKDLDRLLLE